MRRIYILIITVLCCIAEAAAQGRVVTGSVTDGEFKGEPLIGAYVTVDGTKEKKNTVTDVTERCLMMPMPVNTAIFSVRI